MVASRGRSFTYLKVRSTLSNRSNLLLIDMFKWTRQAGVDEEKKKESTAREKSGRSLIFV